ncbi:hypothetical protein PWT90_06021 [Aphanocladium album]|nr:hypothetical protein PWT90_06021 [Aphanocladium album]
MMEHLPWSAAYDEALSMLHDKKRLIIGKGEELEKLFEDLKSANFKQKNESILKRGIAKLQKPTQAVNPTPKTALGAASVKPSAATSAIGACSVEARLDKQVRALLWQNLLKSEWDKLGQYIDDSALLYKAMNVVQTDLLSFRDAVVDVLAKKSLALAWTAEQFNERIPCEVQDFLKQADLLHQQIDSIMEKVIMKTESLLLDIRIRQILGSNESDLQEPFHLALKKATAKDTCEWIKDDGAFCAWYEATAAKPLALYGEMGCGKTTTMASLIDQVTQLNQGRISNAIVLYHYCRDDKTATPLSVCCNLMLQLMHKNPELKVAFHSWFEEQGYDRRYYWAYSPKPVEEFVLNSIGSLEKQVFIFLDGLDACDETACRELLTALNDQLLQTPRLKCCISANYREHIQTSFPASPEIHMPKDPRRDAAIALHMVQEQLPSLGGKARDLVVTELSELGQGNALWVQTAARLAASRKFDDPAELRAFLDEEMPQSSLSDLYRKLFADCTMRDESNVKFLSYALEILAVAERPLSITELAWAEAVREESVLTVRELEGWADPYRLREFLSPFLSGPQSDANDTPWVQFAHPLVKDLVLRSPPHLWAENGQPKKTSNECILKRQSTLHGKMAQVCVKYLLLAEIGTEILPPSDKNEPCSDPAERGLGSLFAYVSCHWLHHLARAELGSGPSLSDVITLTTPGSIRSENWWQHFCRARQPDQSQPCPTSMDPLTIVSLYGPKHLFEELLQKISGPAGDSLQITTSQRENAVRVVREQGDVTRLPMLADLLR